MSGTELWLWALGLLLQAVLLALLVRRGLVRKLPVFAVLLGFYLLRSAGVGAVALLARRPVSPLLLTLLALTDVLLQVALAWEVFAAGPAGTDRFRVGAPEAERTALGASNRTALHGAERTASSPAMALSSVMTLRSAAAFSALVLVAASLAWRLSATVHGSRRFLMDRGVLTTSLLFLLVVALFLWRRPTVVVQRLGVGLAAFAVASLSGQVGRAMAAAGRDVRMFHAWSLVAPVTYLLVLAFWISRLRRSPD